MKEWHEFEHESEISPGNCNIDDRACFPEHNVIIDYLYVYYNTICNIAYAMYTIWCKLLIGC